MLGTVNETHLPSWVSNVIMDVLIYGLILIALVFTCWGIYSAFRYPIAERVGDVEVDGLKADGRGRSPLRLRIALMVLALALVLGGFLPFLDTSSLYASASQSETATTESFFHSVWTTLTYSPATFFQNNGQRSEALLFFSMFSFIVSTFVISGLNRYNYILERLRQLVCIGICVSIFWFYQLMKELLQQLLQSFVSSGYSPPPISIGSFLGIGFYLIAIAAVASFIVATLNAVRTRTWRN